MLEIKEKGTIADRLNQLVDHFCKGNKTAFGRAADIQSGVLAGIVGGRGSKPGFELLQRILTAYSTVEPNWLLFGNGPMLKDSVESTTKYSGYLGAAPILSAGNNVPVIALKSRQMKYYFSRDEKSNPETASYYESDAIESMLIPRSILGDGVDGEFIGFPVMHSMMEPLYEYGDTIICKESKPKNWFQIAKSSIVIIMSKSHPFLMGRFGFSDDHSTVNLSFDERSWNDISLITNDIKEVWEFRCAISSHTDKLLKDTSATQLMKAMQLRLEQIDNKVERVFGSFRERLMDIIIDNKLHTSGMVEGDHSDLALDHKVQELYVSEYGPIKDSQKYLGDMRPIIVSIINEINNQSRK
jgi:hypothetical protein